MTGLTHMVVGANAAWVAVVAGEPGLVPLLAVTGAVAGLLPDLDSGGSKIHFIAGGLLGAFRGTMQHRGFMHSFLAAGFFCGLALLIALSLNPSLLFPLVVFLGYMSHLLIDGFNYAAVPYLFPMKRKFHLLPRLFRTPIKGLVDQLLFILGILGLGLLFLSRYSSTSILPL